MQNQENTLVTPLFQKLIWYNYDYWLSQVRADFKLSLPGLYDEAFFKVLSLIEALPVGADYEKNPALDTGGEDGIGGSAAAWVMLDHYSDSYEEINFRGACGRRGGHL